MSHPHNSRYFSKPLAKRAAGEAPFARVGILYNPNKEKSEPLAREIENLLHAHDVDDVWLTRAWNRDHVMEHLPHTDLLITLGGDGTMLHAARMGAEYDVPMLGVKMGRLGFVAEIFPEDWRGPLERILKGDFWIEERLMIRARVERSIDADGAPADDGAKGDGESSEQDNCSPDGGAQGEPSPNQQAQNAGAQISRAQNGVVDNNPCIVCEYDALNDVVLSRAGLARVIRVSVSLDDGYLTQYTCDGIIVSTATGSTGYALAVNGPILPPELRNILVLPIAPHLSMDRAVVLSEGTEVRLRVSSDHKAVLTVDGQVEIEIDDDDEIVIVGSPHLARFVRYRERNYFYQTLMDKLQWTV